MAYTLNTPKTLFLTAIMSTAFAGQAHAAPTSFTCDGFPYQILTNQLYKLDPVSLTYVSQGPTNSPGLNGSGFNELDNFAYALNSAGVYRLGSNGERTLISTGIGGALHYIGTMDEVGNFYGLKRTNRRRLIKIDIAASEASGTTVFSEVVFSGVLPPSTGDFVYVQNGADEYILLVKNATLYWYDFQTLTTYTQSSTAPAGAPNFNFGATWADDSGRIWGFNNADGDIYELSGAFGPNPTWTLVADLEKSGNNDGFSCNAADFPQLPPVAQDDEFTTQIETALSGNVIADNGNGIDSDPDGATVTVLWSDPGTTTPSNGTVSAVQSDGSFTYTPNAGFYGVDTFNYVLTDGGQTDSAVVTITIPADNSDLPSSYAEALHNVTDTATLGPLVTLDSSPNSNSSADADGDVDEAMTSNDVFSGSTIKTVTVDVTEAPAGGNYLQAWIDWNADDDFDDANEQIATDLTDVDADGFISFDVTVPILTASIDSFLRLRWSTQAGLNVSDIAPNGEVEDYQVQLIAKSELSANKTVEIWDPNNIGLYAVPGNDVIYTITATNTGDVASDADSIFLVDNMPPHIRFYNGDIDDGGPEIDPVSFSHTGSNGLNFTYASDVGYSKSAAAPNNMSECNDTIASGYDPDVNFICFNPKGQFLAGTPDPSFSVSFRARVD